MKKILMGIDYGDVRTGLAVCDALGLLASGVGTVTATGKKDLVRQILDLAGRYGAEAFVMGDPINMNGTVGERSEKVRRFAAFLRSESGKPVILIDERCTTMAAHRFLNETGTHGKKRKAVVDTLSAQIILQNYLDSHPDGPTAAELSASSAGNAAPSDEKTEKD